MIWLVVAAGVWMLVAVPAAVVIGKAIKIADHTEADENRPKLELVRT